MQPVLGLAGFVLLEAQIEVQDHDLFVRGGPGFVAAGGKDVVEEGEGGIGLGDGLEFDGAPEGVFGFVEVGGVMMRHVFGCLCVFGGLLGLWGGRGGSGVLFVGNRGYSVRSFVSARVRFNFRCWSGGGGGGVVNSVVCLRWVASPR